MSPQNHRAPSKLLWPVVVGVAYFIAAALALWLSRSVSGAATIWPASGILLSGLLLRPAERWDGILLASAIASLSANFAFGSSLSVSAGFTFANIVEAMVAATIVRRSSGKDLAFDRPHGVGHFAVACLCASSVSAFLASLLSGDWSGGFTSSWFLTVLLGQLILTPLVMTSAQALRRLRLPRDYRRIAETIALLALVAVVSAVAFWQTHYPLLFLPVLPLLLATYRLGPVGATLSVFTIAVFGSLATSRVTTLFGASWPVQDLVLFFQFYLAALLVAALPLAAALAARDDFVGVLKRQQAYFEMASRTSSIGYWRLTLADSSLEWSEEVYRIHGLPIGEPPLLEDAVNAYHPDDRPLVEAKLDEALQTKGQFAFDARIITSFGELRHINSRGQVEFGDNGEAVALFGIFQDVSDRVRLVEDLRAARVMAEAEARHARELAETDQLTGIPNRRKTMAVLETEIEACRTKGTMLTIGLLDVDRFKSINDSFGHVVGDLVLQDVALACDKAIRTSDFLGRIGGEEFLVLLPGADTAAAGPIAERIRLAVIRDTAAGEVPEVTVSIGLAQFNATMRTSQLLQTADEALYDAKRGGRNRVEIASPC
ncbi:hypothetical protein B2G71_09415 [Novosphingobium sp. PC22D]|uniref:GGDEF domain-containing protein n=1 Tax=Novosphingobium sp. PC22D TaxID=1962403 RepID=UPI000BF0ED9E|nr:sensor domain-containing diguanylate cyclase [Novosphingobium sp. PC22D]PEQ13035.1 hypothetical protein B2G71_09415 [Novosphingobium sp. PC22D]